MADIIIGYNEGKYNREKISILAGNYFVFLGVMLSFGLIILFIFNLLNSHFRENAFDLFFYFFIGLHVLIVGSFYYKILIGK